jgi:hypothetical protein
VTSDEPAHSDKSPTSEPTVALTPTPPGTPPLIYYVEALCVLAALSHCCSSMTPNQKLLLYTDNANVVDIFSSLRCRPEFNTIVKHAITTCVKSQVDLWVLHIPGEMNSVGDAISRVVIESLVRSGYLPLLALTETLTGYGNFGLSH